MKYFKSSLILALLAIISSAKAQTLCDNGFAGVFPCENVDLMAFIPNAEMQVGNNVNDVWGWTSPITGNEYVLLGGFEGSAFIDITNPVNPVFVGFLPSHTVGSLWRDIKVYNNYAFIVSEAGSHGLQVFDLFQLDNIDIPPITFSESAYYDGFGKAHNIAVNEETGFAYIIGANTFSGGLHIVNIQDPLNPVIAGGFAQDGYTHDCQAVVYHGPDTDYAGKEVVFACNTDALTIVDVEDKTDCYMISTEGYEGVGYTHQGWLTEDHKYFLIGDELDEINLGGGTKTFIWDVQDLDYPMMIGIFENDVLSIDHNLYTLDNFIYQSNYRSGLRILDGVDIENHNLYEIGYFDVDPNLDEASFAGSWSNYPYFASGNIPVTDMYDGLFIVKPHLLNLTEDFVSVECGIDEAVFSVDVHAALMGSFIFESYDFPEEISFSGSLLAAPGQAEVNIQGLSSLTPGIYNFTIQMISEFGVYELPASLEIVSVMPETPVLTSPDEAAEILFGSDDFLTWNAVSGAMEYVVQISQDSDFSAIYFDENTGTETSFSLDANWNPDLLEGIFYWRVLAIGACAESELSTQRSFVWLFSSIAERALLELIDVYPNPSDGLITIQSELNETERCSLFSAEGKLIQNMVISKGQNIVDLSTLEKGVYLLRFKAGALRLIRN